ncbi:hypothetical protein [Spongiimicrobium salis]|uniref:hypothetical protein n=1 Tax=Spongiimicrobium salis TaxID=1667022 RepID=UPI00374CC287
MIRHTFLRMGRILFWTIVPMLFVSHNPVGEEVVVQSLLNSSYHLKATGDLEEDLVGDFDFETATKIANDGTKFSTLVLRLENNKLDHAVEFLISKKDMEANAFKGTYEVSENINGFLNYFDGVFGYADIDALGELPFFASKGRISIQEIDKDMLSGTLSVTLRNAKGEMINLVGSFAANK